MSAGVLAQLTTLREFLTGMGFHVIENRYNDNDEVIISGTSSGGSITERDLRDTLKKCGYSVELALERIVQSISDCSTGGGGGNGIVTSSSLIHNDCTKTTPGAVRKASSAATTTAADKTPNKRYKSCSRHYDYDDNATSRLLLCKRWTVATSTNPRRGGCLVKFGETLDFRENYIIGNNGKKKMQQRGSSLGKGPLTVRFRSKSSSSSLSSLRQVDGGGGSVQGVLSRYLSSILSPLLRYHSDSSERTLSSSSVQYGYSPLISIEGKTMMEDRGLLIGSEIPIVLEVYINDPTRFFSLFRSQQNENHHDEDYASYLKGRLKKISSSSVSAYDRFVTEAAFRLLQWAEKGGEEEEAFVLAQENGLRRSTSSSFKGYDNDDDDNDVNKRERKGSEQDMILMEEKGEVLVDEEDVDDKFNQLLISSSPLNDNESKQLPELSDPKRFRSGIALRPYQRQALYFMCRREGVIINEHDFHDDDGNDDDDNELNSLLAEQLIQSRSVLSKENSDNTSEQAWDGINVSAVSCTCGPVVVHDETVATSAIPVIEFHRFQTPAEFSNRKQGKYTHHPLWQRRYLVKPDDYDSIYAFYVNELLGVASSCPPNPPKKCCGGIFADAMGLGKTVVLLALILKTKEQEENCAISQEKHDKICTAVSSKDASGFEYTDNHYDEDNYIDNDDDQDDELWTDETGKTVVMEHSCHNETKSRGTTLVIVPLSLVSQWEEELTSKTDLSHLLCYDSTTKSLVCNDFANVDVIVTTYGTVQSLFESSSRSCSIESSKKKKHPLFEYDWRRVILDEAHVIKNPSTLVSKACCALKSESRWCVTGTPIQNSLQDVFGLLKFLRHEPWCNTVFWRNTITNPVTRLKNSSEEANKNEFSYNDAFGRVRRLLAPILLRRTKSTLTAGGTPIISLPPIDYSVVEVHLSPPEREFYNALLERSQSIFEGFLNAGVASKSWFAIFSLLQRLRQACDHVSLTVKNNACVIERNMRIQAESASHFFVGGETVDNDFLSSLLMKFKSTSALVDGGPTFARQVAETLSGVVRSNEEFMKNECPICLDEPRVENAVYTPCAHMFCRDCLLPVLRDQMIRSKNANVHPTTNGGTCPICHSWVDEGSIVQIVKSENGATGSKFFNTLGSGKENRRNAMTDTISTARTTLESAMNGAKSSKLEAILAELEKVRNDGKVLMFSQFLGFIDIINDALTKRGVKCFRIDGSLSLKERVAAVCNFNNSPNGTVFLISMKAGGVGLNLVSASTVFIVDPWWNQAIEDQCINRIHRIGQRAKIVHVRKFVVTDSVEEKIIDIQAKKKGMANEIFSEVDEGQLDGATKPSLEDFKLLLGR